MQEMLMITAGLSFVRTLFLLLYAFVDSMILLGLKQGQENL
jgi:hypothetical protein